MNMVGCLGQAGRQRQAAKPHPELFAALQMVTAECEALSLALQARPRPAAPSRCAPTPRCAGAITIAACRSSCTIWHRGRPCAEINHSNTGIGAVSHRLSSAADQGDAEYYQWNFSLDGSASP